MTPLYVSIAASVASILLILVVLELIRSRRLRERIALARDGDRPAHPLGLARRPQHDRRLGHATRRPCSSPSQRLILAVLLHYSTVISKLADQNVIPAQRLALLEERTRESLARNRTADRRHRLRPSGRHEFAATLT